MTRYLPYSRQCIEKDDIDAINKVIVSDYITRGPMTEKFEEQLAKYCQAKYAVVFSSGTASLHASYSVAGLTCDNNIITSPITFVATANAALFLDSKPKFVDVNLDTGNINIDNVKDAVDEKTSIVAPVHYAGNVVDLLGLKKILPDNILIIEDACHALGSTYMGSKTGSCEYSDMVVFSFHPLKTITMGEGGAVLTNNKEFYNKLKMFRNHGITKDEKEFLYENEGGWYHEMHTLGYNYWPTEIQCALGLSQLEKIDRFVEKRKYIANIYNEKFVDNIFFDIPENNPDGESSWHLYPLRLRECIVDKKREIFQHLKKNGLGVQVHYIPVHRQPYYRSLGYQSTLPISEQFYKKEISIPIFPSMSDDDIEFVVNGILSSCEYVF